MADSSTLRSRALGAALRKARLEERPRQSLREFAADLGIRFASLSEWETGKKVPKAEDVARILTALGVSQGEYARIMDLARNAHESNWLMVGIPGVSQQLAGTIECEGAAHTITCWAPLVIPGLLHTSDYARKILSGSDRSRGEVEMLVQLRMGRRDVLTRPAPVNLVALIAADALYTPVGSPETMVNQLGHLLEMAERDNVVLQVVDKGLGWHHGLMGSFTIYDFPEFSPVVELEHYRTGAFLADEEDVNSYREVVDTIRSAAMSTKDSAEYIRYVITETTP